MTKTFNHLMTEKRKEFERISNEIQLNFKHKMFLLRSDMEKRRKNAINMIESKKNVAIHELTSKHS